MFVYTFLSKEKKKEKFVFFFLHFFQKRLGPVKTSRETELVPASIAVRKWLDFRVNLNLWSE